jgi:hypothetical protein
VHEVENVVVNYVAVAGLKVGGFIGVGGQFRPERWKQFCDIILENVQSLEIPLRWSFSFGHEVNSEDNYIIQSSLYVRLDQESTCFSIFAFKDA